MDRFRNETGLSFLGRDRLDLPPEATFATARKIDSTGSTPGVRWRCRERPNSAVSGSQAFRFHACAPRPKRIARPLVPWAVDIVS
jgi:hypothetical protein